MSELLMILAVLVVDIDSFPQFSTINVMESGESKNKLAAHL